jgi:hypothetical protein
MLFIITHEHDEGGNIAQLRASPQAGKSPLFT